jgi:subfamily B ATP-binding cassette protein MsbA
MRDSIKLYVRLLAYVKPYANKFLLSICFMLLLGMVEPLLPALLRPLVDVGFSGVSKAWIEVNWIPVLLVGVFVLKGGLEYFGGIFSQYVANAAVRDIRSDIFRARVSKKISERDGEDVGEFISSISYDANQVSAAITSAFLIIIKDSLVILGLTGYLFYMSWKLTLIVFFSIPVVSIFIAIASTKLRISNKILMHQMARMTAFLRSVYGGIRDVKIYQAEEAAQKRFDHQASAILDEVMRATKIQALNLPLVQILASIGVAAVIFSALELRAQEVITAGFFVSYITALALIFEPIRRIANSNLTIQKGLAAAEKIFRVIDSDPDRTPSDIGLRRPNAALKMIGCSTSPFPESGFRLNAIDLKLRPGFWTALVGGSGAGKSTLLSVLYGFTPISSGSVSVGKSDVTGELAGLRGLFATVGQQPYIFTGSVRENLDPSGTTGDLALVKALETAKASDFVRDMGGLDALIVDDGAELSGGQRQRLAIARAIAKDAPFLILDEATNALEESLEMAILHDIKGALRDRAVLLVTHRLSLVSMTDEVIILENGHVAASGRTEEVIQTPTFNQLRSNCDQ